VIEEERERNRLVREVAIEAVLEKRRRELE
jgi:hypothetical protein